MRKLLKAKEQVYFFHQTNTEISNNRKGIFSIKTVVWWNTLKKKIKNPLLSLGRFKNLTNEVYLKLFLMSPFLHKFGKSWKDFRIIYKSIPVVLHIYTLYYNKYAYMTCTIVHLYVGNECLLANFLLDSECTNKIVSLSNACMISIFS